MSKRAFNTSKIDEKEFLKLYISGKNFKQISEVFDICEIYVKDFFYGNYLAPERLKIKKERAKNMKRGNDK